MGLIGILALMSSEYIKPTNILSGAGRLNRQCVLHDPTDMRMALLALHI